MTRKLCMLLAVVLAVTGAFFAPAASAQGAPTCVIPFVGQPAPDPLPTVSTVGPVAGTDTTTDSASAEAANDVAAQTHTCADAAAYPGPFTNMPTSPSSPYAAPVDLSASEPVAAAPASVESPSTGLAHSGSEVFVLAYLGTGLLAFGAVALGMHRGAHVE